MKVQKRILLILFLFCIINFSFTSSVNTSSQFSFLSFIKTAYDAYNKVKNFMDPDPNLADLINQAKDEILEEINLVRAEEQIGNVNALIEEYTIYLNNPPTEQTMEAWIRDAINVVNQFELIIQNKSPRIAYLSAKSYNMLIPLMALMMQREGIRTEDILPLFEDVITTNQALIGQYCWDEMPNAPLYWDQLYSDGSYVGKLLKCYTTDEINWMEYLNMYDIIWFTNEELRRITIEGYDHIWYHISNERAFESHPISPEDNKYLFAHSRTHRTYSKVSPEDLQTDDNDFLWRLDFVTAQLVKIVHWSGKCLEAGTENNVLLKPETGMNNQIWYFDKCYTTRPAIRSYIAGEPCLAVWADSVYLSPRGVVPSVSQRWIIQYACRKNINVGSSADPSPADYDGDGIADLGMKIDDGRWLIDFANNGFGAWDQEIKTLTYLSKQSHPATADYDGDGKADISIKDDFSGKWYIDYASDGYGNWNLIWEIPLTSFLYQYYPVPADYDGDGKADIGLRDDTGGWFINYSSNGFDAFDVFPHVWGVLPVRDAYPAPADYDGDGKTDVSKKQDDGRWLIDYANNGFSTGDEWDWISEEGMYGDISAFPLPGNYNRNRNAEIGIRTDEGRWMVDDIVFGWEGIIDWKSNPIYGGKDAHPIPADYDGDGMMDLSVIGEDGIWSIDFSANGFGFNMWDWSSDMPLTTNISSDEMSRNHSAVKIRDYILSNYPNPFNLSTTINYSVLKPDHVIIKIYNIIGHEILTLVDETKNVGEFSITWDGKDISGEIMPTGIYIYQMLTKNTTRSNKMLLIK